MANGSRDRTWHTTDFAVACYVFSKRESGFNRLLKFERIPNARNQFTFYFADDGPKPCRDLALDFVNSESYQFDSAQRALKKLCLESR